MENFLSFLKSLTEPWLSFGSTFLGAEPTPACLTGAGLLLLYLWYLILKPFLPSLGTARDIRKPQGRTRRGRKSTLKGQRTWQREAEEVTKLLSVVQSLLGPLNDTTGLQQLLCPDPLHGFCTSEMAKVSRLFSQASLQDDGSSLSSWTSRDSVTDTSFPLPCTPITSPQEYPIPAPASGSSTPYPSTVSPKEVAPLGDLISAPPLSDSVPPESVSSLKSKLPVGSIPVHQPPSFPPPIQYSAVLHPQAVHSLVCRQSELSIDVSTTKAIDRAICTTSKSSQQRTVDSVQSITQELPKVHSLASFRGCKTAALSVEPRNSSSTNPGDLPPLERQEQRDEYCLISDRKMKISEPFPKPLHTSRITSAWDTDPQDSVVEGKPEEMPVHLQSRDPKASEEQEENGHKEFFFGHPSLHSESLVLMASGSGDTSEKSTCCNRISDSPVHPYPIPLSSSESQPQSSPPNLLTPQSQQVPPAKTKVQSQSPVLILPLSPVSQFQDCGMCLHSSQDEAQPLVPSQTHQQEDSILKEGQEQVWGLPSVVKKSQKEFGPLPRKLSLEEASSRAHVPRSVPPVDFPLNAEFQKKMEHHLRKRSIQQCYGLPQRVLESWSEMGFHRWPPVSPEWRSRYGESTRKSGRILKDRLAPQDTDTTNCKDQLSSELNCKPEDRQHTQALEHINKMSLSSEELLHKPPVTHDQCPTSGDMTDSPTLDVLLTPGESSIEQGKEGSWAPACALGHGVNQNSPSAHQRKLPQTGKPGELGGNDTGLGRSQTGGKRQPLPENHVRKQIKHFLQWLSPGRPCKGSQRTPQKSTLVASSLQGTGHQKGQTAFPAYKLGKRATRHAEKMLKEERGLVRAAGNTTRSQGSPLPVKSWRPKHKKERQTRAESVLKLYLHYQSSCLKWTPSMAYSQTTARVVQKTWIGHGCGQCPKCLALQDKPLC